ncbi:hypothetical protein Tco_0477240 [Tanacetum coccineum]
MEENGNNQKHVLEILLTKERKSKGRVRMVEAPNVTSFHVTATRALTKLLSCRTLRFCSYDSDTQNAIEDHGTVSPYGVTSSGGRLIRHICVATLLMYIFSLLLCL